MNTTTASGPKTATPETSPLDLEVAGGNALATTDESSRKQHTLARARQSLADLERKIHHYPEPIRTHVRWLQGYWLDKCQGNNASLRAVAAKAGWDKSEEWYYNLLCGYNFRSNGAGDWKTGGKAWSEFLEIFEAIKRYAEASERQGRMHFVVTPTYTCISDFITARRALNAVCKIGGLTGPTGGQKSHCLKHYSTLNNHGQVVRIEAPAHATIPNLQRKIAERYQVPSSRLSHAATREAQIRENLNETRCLIIDNSQRLFFEGKGSNQPCFNWLLELQEDNDCTLILSWTTDFTDQLTAGRAKGYFEQFIGRMGGINDILRLPDFTPVSDLRVIAKSFGLDPGKGAMEYLHRWSRADGRIRIVFQKLQRAQEFSRLDERARITLDDLAEADAWTPPAIGTDEGGES